MKVITVKIPEDTDKRLDSICKETTRTKSFFVRKAIEQFLSKTAVYQKALDRLNDVTDEVISLEEMDKEIQ